MTGAPGWLEDVLQEVVRYEELQDRLEVWRLVDLIPCAGLAGEGLWAYYQQIFITICQKLPRTDDEIS